MVEGGDMSERRVRFPLSDVLSERPISHRSQQLKADISPGRPDLFHTCWEA